MKRRHGSPDVGIAFISADHEGARFGDGEIAARHARPRRQKSGTSVVSHDFSQKVRVVIVRVGTDGAGEQLSHVLPRFVDGGEHNVAGRLSIKLLDSFTQVRFDDLDSAVLEIWRHAALLLEHGLALDQFLHVVVTEDGVHDVVVLGGIPRPVNVRATLGGIRLELFQVVVEVSERMLFDVRGNLA